MNESNYNRFDPESQFMLTCPGKRLPVSTGSPQGDCSQERTEAVASNSSERSDRDNDLTYKLDGPKDYLGKIQVLTQVQVILGLFTMKGMVRQVSLFTSTELEIDFI